MIWKAIWNGPFYVGRLEQPISMGAAFLKVLETLWRARMGHSRLHRSPLTWMVALTTADDRYESTLEVIPPASTLWMCRKAPPATIGKASRFSVKVEHVTLAD